MPYALYFYNANIYYFVQKKAVSAAFFLFYYNKGRETPFFVHRSLCYILISDFLFGGGYGRERGLFYMGGHLVDADKNLYIACIAIDSQYHFIGI